MHAVCTSVLYGGRCISITSFTCRLSDSLMVAWRAILNVASEVDGFVLNRHQSALLRIDDGLPTPARRLLRKAARVVLSPHAFGVTRSRRHR